MKTTHRNTLKENDSLQNGKYRILKVLGQGGFGITYLVHHTVLKGDMAIKELFLSSASQFYCTRTSDNTVLPQFDTDEFEKFKQKFNEEARTLFTLKGIEGVVQVIETFEENGTSYFIMEFIKGKSLSKLIKENGILSEQQAIEYILQILETMQQVHEKGILHRDIKPDNILIDENNKPVIVDFGIAREYDQDVTKTHTTFRTPGYYAPEQASSRAKRGAYTDIYSIGATLYYMLTGTKPESIDDRHMFELTNPSEYNSELSQQLNDIIVKSLNLKPSERYQYCYEMLEAIKNINPEEKVEKEKKEKEEKEKEEKEKKEKEKKEKEEKKEYVVNEVTTVKEVITEQAYVKEQKDTLVETSDTKKGTLVDKPDITNKNKVEKFKSNVKKQQAKPVNKPKHNNAKSTSPRLKLYMGIAAVISVMAVVLFFILSDKPSKPSKPSKSSNPSKPKYPKMVFIKGGTFQMGGNKYSDEKPIHRVRVSDFYIGKYEVTFAQYDAFCEATNRKKPDDEGWGRGSRPVINVNWNDAVAYCKWLSQKTGYEYRLPTEAEWEYAAGGGNTHQEWAGTNSSSSLGSFAWYGTNNNGKTHPVGGKQPNKLGLYDMSGNVWEWCSDYYINSPSSNPQGLKSGSFRVYRGGSWHDFATYCRVAFRFSSTPTFRDGVLGFRVVHR